MKVGVLGSGDVAKTLASGFLKHGHEVMMGTREPTKLKEWAGKNPKGKVGSFGDAASFGGLVVLAVKGSASAEALRAAGASNLSGKPVIDATNPIADAPPVNGVLRVFTSLDESGCSASSRARNSSRPSIPWAPPSWSTRSSRGAGPPCSSAAMTKGRRRR